MLLGLEPGYRGHDERLERRILSAVLALIGGGVAFLLTVTFLSFPAWVSPRSFTALFVSPERNTAVSVSRQAVPPAVLPGPQVGEILAPARGGSDAWPEAADGPTEIASPAPEAGKDDLPMLAGAILEADRAGWVPTRPASVLSSCGATAQVCPDAASTRAASGDTIEPGVFGPDLTAHLPDPVITDQTPTPPPGVDQPPSDVETGPPGQQEGGPPGAPSGPPGQSPEGPPGKKTVPPGQDVSPSPPGRSDGDPRPRGKR